MYPELKTIEEYLDVIYENQKSFFNNKTKLKKRDIGSVEFNGVSLNSDIIENEVKTEIFAAFRNDFILSFTLNYRNEKEKKEVYQILNNIKI